MEREEFRKLLHRYANGSCTKSEKRFLEDTLLRKPIVNNWSWDSEEEKVLMKVRIKATIDGRRFIRRRSRWPKLWYGGVAASLFAAFGLVWYLIGNNGPTEEPLMISETAVYPSDGIRLTLADGSIVGLDSLQQGLVGSTGNVDIHKLDGDELIYELSNDFKKGVEQAIVAQNTLHVPNGKQFKLTLPDGTNVWMNTATTLTYPVAFTGSEREIILDGEAYFEVAHDLSKPFIVMTHGREITVTGTHFAVSSYTSDEQVRTTLFEGGVNVSHQGKTLSLTPGLEAVSWADGKLVKQQGNLEQAMAWKNGYFIFDNMDVISVMRCVARWYDVRVEISPKYADIRFGGSFPVTATIDELLKDLETVGKIKFERHGKEVRLM